MCSRWAEVYQAIERLRSTYREVFVLREIEERSYEDIAEILKLPGRNCPNALPLLRLREFDGHGRKA